MMRLKGELKWAKVILRKCNGPKLEAPGASENAEGLESETAYREVRIPLNPATDSERIRPPL
ncbi:MAG TPA: hypothetical protein PKW52_06375, partial [Nitrospira sp.]|nr:hypothetical protein [Nitrospira sp.]